jgi:GTP-dependent phosphoenolpyruvate carboxykinase
MEVMTRMGRAALERIATESSFVRGLHSIGDLNPARRFSALPAGRRAMRAGSPSTC